MINFNKIVKKVLKKRWKVMLRNDIFDIIDPEKKDINKTTLNKTIYNLKSQWYIIPIKNWVYIIPDEEDLSLNNIDLLEKYFFKLLKKYISSNCQNNYYISGLKSLEFHLKDFSVPMKITVINRSIDKQVLIWNYCIVFKTISGSFWGKKINLYSKFSSMTKIVSVLWVDFKTSNMELSLLENALIYDNEIWVNVFLLNKFIKKYHKYFNKDNFYFIWQYKYIMSMNRLKEITKNIDKDLYEVFLDIIKKNWWLFIWEWLRNI